MGSDPSPPLSSRQLAKHVAAGLPIGLLLGFLAGTIAYVGFMSPYTMLETRLLSESVALLYRAAGVLLAVHVGVCVTGAWIWHAEDTSTGIRLCEVFAEDTDGQS